jgi:hypothetical protein
LVLALNLGLGASPPLAETIEDEVDSPTVLTEELTTGAENVVTGSGARKAQPLHASPDVDVILEVTGPVNQIVISQCADGHA